jgi:serine/threonine protein phosphatase PrpC
MSEFNDTLDPTIRVVQPRNAAIDPARVTVDVGALTSAGRVRTNNEDHFLVARLGRALATLATNLPDDCFPAAHASEAYAMLVADGMGGAAGGEIASREAVRGILDLAIETPDWILLLDERTKTELLRRFAGRFRTLRESLVERVRAEPALAGMGTTLTIACSLGAELVVAHAGDSRVYLLRAGSLQQLTRDHTMAQALANAGVIRQDDVAVHPMAHVLTNALGTHEGTVQVELHSLVLEHGDHLMLCTDGLTDMVEDSAIMEALLGAASAEEACRELVRLALEGGGRDNVTVVVARYDFGA